MDRNINLRPFERVISNLTAVWWLSLLPALSLIGFGVAILIWPELLAFLVATFLITTGTAIMAFAWRIRATTHRVEELKEQVRHQVRNERNEPEVVINRFERRMYKAW